MDKKGVWSLAPAFDMTFAYRKDSLWVSGHQMLINGKSEDIDESDFAVAAKNVGIRKSDAVECIGRVRDAVSEWASFAGKAGLSKEKTEAIGRQIHF